MKKHLSATIRHLTNLSTECLRAGQLDLMKEVQQMIIRLLEVQEAIQVQEAK